MGRSLSRSRSRERSVSRRGRPPKDKRKKSSSSSSRSSSGSPSPQKKRVSKSRSADQKPEKKKEKRRSSSSSSSSDSSSSSGSSSSEEDTKKKRRNKKLKKKLKKKKAKEKKKKNKLKKMKKYATKGEKAELEAPLIPAPVSVPVEHSHSYLQTWQNEDGAEHGPVMTDEQKASFSTKRPLTKEEYEARQSVIRRVTDPETGRTRLVRGDGEILEEIVSKDRHKEINKQATKGDGRAFQKRLRTNR
ncbi:ADP-ribosylation factor-like protein 6-interacting protein 4 [Brachyhypopomus gauderio]|uniref:ADP-ribosylation factor-like protein 6-interacting protein 4 n=1 Tax=Brachyhypopomus gauderio TaxID=698409 RepID=UPI0040415477